MRAARWLVSRVAPREWRESMTGDLEEERRRRPGMGRHAGELWALAAALGAVGELWVETLRGGTMSGGGSAIFGGLMSDVRVTVRSLCRSPRFTLPALGVLTMGIGAATAMFAIVHAIVLRPLPFDEPERLVAIGEVHHRLAAPGLSNLGSVAAPNFYDWQEALTNVHLAASTSATGFTIRDGDQPEELRALRATASLFEVLRVRPTLGRTFTTEHEVQGSDRVAVISDGFWRRQFGGDARVIGRTLHVDSGTWEVIGVLPAGFAYPFGVEQPPDLFVPYVPNETARSRTASRNYNLRVVGRLRSGASVAQLDSEIRSVTAAVARDFPEWFPDRSPGVLSLHEATVGRVRGRLFLSLGAVGFVLLIACVNLANLMLARATTRARESQIRAALGASRWRIARGVLAESVVLVLAGTAGGVVLAAWGLRALGSMLPATLPRVAAIQIDAGVLATTAVVALIVAIVAGLGPAHRASARETRLAVDAGGRSGIGRPRRTVGAVLVVAEVALAVVPLVGAGLFTASFRHVTNVDLGLDYRNVLTVSVAPRLTATGGDVQEPGLAGAQAIDDALTRLRMLPGVEAVAALSGGVPFSGSWNSSALTVGGTTFDDPDDRVQLRSVTPDYAKVIRTEVHRGRYVSEADVAGAPAVVILNEEAVRRFFGEQDPVGAVVQLRDAPRIVVGVVGDVRVRGPEQPVSPEAYIPWAQMPSASASVLIRTADDPTRLAQDVSRIVLDVAPGVPVVPSTLESLVQRMVAPRELNMLLTSLFGVLAVAIAAVGIHGVMAYTVAQQQQEIGVRIALGASPGNIMRMVLARATLLVGAGLALGGVGASVLAGSIRAFLFEIQPYDPTVFAGVGIVIVVTGLAAAWIPARWAARVDPIVAMQRS